MNLSFVFLQAAGGGDYSFLIMMVAIFAIMYFFMICLLYTSDAADEL